MKTQVANAPIIVNMKVGISSVGFPIELNKSSPRKAQKTPIAIAEDIACAVNLVISSSY